MLHRVKFFADESGSHRMGGTYVIAGFLATAENWEHFQEDWSNALAEAPSIGYFKRSENYHGDGQFADWPECERERKLYRMIDVFKRYSEAIYELSSQIAWDEYESVIRGTAVEACFGNPYFLCFHGVVSLAIESIKSVPLAAGTSATIEFAFDQQDHLESDALAQYGQVYRRFLDLAKFMSGCYFKDDKKTPALQAADLIAWQIHRDLVRPPEDKGVERPELSSLRKIYKYAPKMRVWSASGLAQFVANMEMAPGSGLVSKTGLEISEPGQFEGGA